MVRGLVCSLCNKKITKHDEGLACSKCSGFVHLACSKISESEFVRLRQEKLEKDWVCEACTTADCTGAMIVSAEVPKDTDVTVSNGNCGIERHYLKEIIRQKDLVIENQKVAIQALQEQLILLRANVYVPSATSIGDGRSEVSTYAEAVAGNSTSTSVASPSVHKLQVTRESEKDHRGRHARKNTAVSKIVGRMKTPIAVERTTRGGQLRAGMEEITGLGYGVASHLASNDKNRPVVGTRIFNEDDNTLNLRAVKKKAFIHVYKLHPDTEVDALTAYLTPSFPEVKVDKLVPATPRHYASFKIEVDYDNKAGVEDPELWPSGACVRRFFHRRKSVEARI